MRGLLARAGLDVVSAEVACREAKKPHLQVVLAIADKPQAGRVEERHDMMTMTVTVHHPLRKLLDERIAIIDGAMGTTIRTYGMTEADIRGERFKDAKKDLLNNGDLFSLTQPKMICDIHRRFLEAGADIIETNTFGATSITQSEFFVDDPREHGGRKDPAFYQKIIEDQFLGDLAWEINEQSARQCREWADRVANADGRQRFVAGAIGPLTVSLSNSPDADDAGFRVVTFDQVKAAYVAAGARADRGRRRRAAGRDHLRLAQRQGGAGRDPGGVRRRTASELPIMISAAVGRGGETMISAQTVEAFWNAVEHVKPLVGRAQLLARPGPHVPVPVGARGEVERGRSPAIPNAGLAEPAVADRLRSRAGGHGPLPRRVRRRGPHQHRRRLLRQHARAHRGDRAGARRTDAPRAVAARRPAPTRPRPSRRRPSRRGRCASRARSRSRSSRAST